MGSYNYHVKQLLATARIHQRPELLTNVVKQLLATEAKNGTSSTELRVLCSEVAVELQQWQIAAELLRGIGTSNETRLLRIRKQFCDVLVALHEVDEQQNLSENDKAQEKLLGAATVLQAVADGVDMWPESLEAVLIGIRALWSIISPLYDAGRQAEVCDAVVFLATLHQQLHIGGGHTLVQWMARSALCLYAADRVTEAFAHFSAALDAAALMSNQRLYVQLLRMSACVVCAKEKSMVNAKGRSEFLGAYRTRPVVYAVLLTQLIAANLVDVDSYREELHTTFDTLQSGNAEIVSPAEAAAAAAGKGKKKQPVAKQPPPPTRTTETFAITDAEVIDEVKSDLLLCIALCDRLTPQQEEELERKRSSANRRVRSFTAYTALVQEASRRGVAQLNTRADAAVLTVTHRTDMIHIAQQLVFVLKGTNAIHDESERQYTQHVGVSLLWNYLLPFLQPSCTTDVQSALDVILDCSQAALPHLRGLFLQVGLQQCHVAFNEDHRTTLHHLLPLLQHEYARSAARHANAQIEFPLQWMQHQLTLLEEPESSLTNEQDRCLYAIEQARAITNPLKRIPLLKTAFQHLPPLVREEGPAEAPQPEPPTKHSSQAPPPPPQPARVPVQRRSTVQLYQELLSLCMEDVSPSLYTVAGAVAEALRTLPQRQPPAPTVDDLEEIQAAASLHSATLLWKQLEEESVPESSRASTVTVVSDAPKISFANRSSGEAQLGALLKETAQRGALLESRRLGSGAWLVANACITFLRWKQRAYAAGDYSAQMADLLELHATYAALFAKNRVQDVSLLSDLTVSAVVGLLSAYILSKVSVSSALQSSTNRPQGGGYAGLIRRIQTCTIAESSNAHLRRAEALCRESMQLISSPRQKWFLAMLYPTVLRLLNEKLSPALHPQEQLLLCLGVLAGPSLSSSERQSMMEQEMLALLRKDPSVRLCAWVASIAADMQLEEVVLDCCQLADALYDTGRLGWDSLFDVQRSSAVAGGAAGAAAVAAKTADSLGGGGGGGAAAALGSTLSGAASAAANKKVSMSVALVQRDNSVAAKPDEDDWGAFAQLLWMKTRVCANHLQGLSGNVRRIALQQLFTNCVNAAIAGVHGPAAGHVDSLTRAFAAYYCILRNYSAVPLSDAAFILPSLRMLLSKALLTQIPKREWNATFTELVYQLGTVLVYVSYSSGRDEDVQSLSTHLRLLRDLLPPRYQRGLRVRETTEVCYRNPSVEGFLQLSRNMEAELQTHGWLIVAQTSTNATEATEAFALALAGTQANSLARAQCLFEYAYTSLQHGTAALTQTTDQLREALRTLEGLPDRAPLLRDGAVDHTGLNAALAYKSLTASFLRSSKTHTAGKSDEAATPPVAKPKRATGKAAVTATTTKKAAVGAAACAPTVTFQHVFLGLRIVALLFRVTAPSAPLATGTGATAVKASKSASAPASRRECASVMLDYISCLWELCVRALREAETTMTTPKANANAQAESADAEARDWRLPTSVRHYYGFAVPNGVAQRMRLAIAAEELQLNTEGLWQELLELGDFLVRTGDEAHAFIVFAWLRFSAFLIYGDATSSAESALVQRVCLQRMCIAATASGLSDAPYTVALQRLEDNQVPLESSALKPSVAEKSTSWLQTFLLAECEARISFGQVGEAAAVASQYFLRERCDGDAAFSDGELNGRRILALRELVRAQPDNALRLVDECLQSVQSHRNAFESTSPFTVQTWIRLCVAKLNALLARKSTHDALQWVAAVREQLAEWRAVVCGAKTASATLRLVSLRAALSDAVQYWVRELTLAADNCLPTSTSLRLFPALEAPMQNTAVAIFREIVTLTESAETVVTLMYRAAAQWRLRERVTPRWVAEHASSVEEHLRPRLETLLAEMRSLQQYADLLNVVAPPAIGEDDTNVTTASSFFLWRAFVLYWTAVDRLEASRIVECLLGNFRRLSMADLQLPTSDAPAHLEKAVLKFIRGVADTEAAPAGGTDGTDTGTNARQKVGARWQETARSTTAEMQQALQHYGLPVQEAKALLDVSTIPPLLRQAVALSQRWPHTHLACAILTAFAQVEVQRHTENQITVTDDMIGERLERQREAVLTAAWNRNPLTPPKTDKAGNRARKSLSSGKQRSSNEASHTFTAVGLSAEDQALLLRVKAGAEEAVRHIHFDAAEVLYDHLSNLAALFGRPQLAAAAAEQMQACQLVGFLVAKNTQEMTDSAEGRLWRQLTVFDPLLRGAGACKSLLETVLLMSPLGRYVRSCVSVCVDEKADDEPVPTSSHTREAVTIELSPYAIDAPVLTIALSSTHAGYCHVVLRHPDGGVEGRRKLFPETEWRTLVNQFEGMQSQKSEVLGAVSAGRLGSAAQRITSEDATSGTDPLSTITSKLLAEFQPSLQSYCVKTPLYLCVAPAVQPFAWEQTSVLSACSVVLRELGAGAVVAKYNEPTRTLRRPSTHGSRAAGPSSPKGAPAGPSVCIVDAFGDHTGSAEALFSAESAKSKNTQQVVVTCSSPGSPPDPAYVTWVLNASSPSAVLVDMCGSLADAVPLPHLSVLRLTQVNVAVLADGAVNAESRQREERQQLNGEADAGVVHFVPPRWMVQLLLLIRGARLVVANTFPCSPDVSDALTRRCLSSVSSAKGLVEQLKGKTKDTKTPLVTLYGAFGSGSTKQKA